MTVTSDGRASTRSAAPITTAAHTAHWSEVVQLNELIDRLPMPVGGLARRPNWQYVRRELRLQEVPSNVRDGSSDRVTSRAFVGRVRELAELTAGLEEASSGRGRLFLVSGEPGIGKTRLADELGIAAANQGLSVHWGRCREGGGAPAYWPWVQLLRGMIRSREAEPLADSITLIIPELRQRSPNLAAASASLEHEDARFRLFDSTTTFLKDAAKSQPLLLILDDLHSADRASLLLLRFLAEQLRDANILLLATYRDLEVERQPEVARILGEIGRDGQHVPLAGLSEYEVARFVHKGVGLSPSEGLVAPLHGITRGTPFFVDEIIRSLAA